MNNFISTGWTGQFLIYHNIFKSPHFPFNYQDFIYETLEQGMAQFDIKDKLHFNPYKRAAMRVSDEIIKDINTQEYIFRNVYTTIQAKNRKSLGVFSLSAITEMMNKPQSIWSPKVKDYVIVDKPVHFTLPKEYSPHSDTNSLPTFSTSFYEEDAKILIKIHFFNSYPLFK